MIKHSCTTDPKSKLKEYFDQLKVSASNVCKLSSVLAASVSSVCKHSTCIVLLVSRLPAKI